MWLWVIIGFLTLFTFSICYLYYNKVLLINIYLCKNISYLLFLYDKQLIHWLDNYFLLYNFLYCLFRCLLVVPYQLRWVHTHINHMWLVFYHLPFLIDTDKLPILGITSFPWGNGWYVSIIIYFLEPINRVFFNLSTLFLLWFSFLISF